MRILVGLAVLALATPALANCLVNPGFEAGNLNGWTTSNVMIDPSSYVPDGWPGYDADPEGPAHNAGDSNCNDRNSQGYQTAFCCPGPDTYRCILTGVLAGGSASGVLQYYVRVRDGDINGPVMSGASLVLQGTNNWVPFEFDLGPCDPAGRVITVEFGSTGNGAWGAAGYHVDAFVLECVIPEPTTLGLLCLAGLPLLRRRR